MTIDVNLHGNDEPIRAMVLGGVANCPRFVSLRMGAFSVIVDTAAKARAIAAALTTAAADLEAADQLAPRV